VGAARGEGLAGGVAAVVGRHPVPVMIAAFAVLPLIPFPHPAAAFPFVGFSRLYEALAAQILIWGLFALGYNILLGYTGILSFGHAAYWGLGGYGLGLAVVHLRVGFWAGLGIGVGAATLGAALFGLFCLHRRGIYFAMLTLAFAQLLYFIVLQTYSVTGGDDGLRGLAIGEVGLPGGYRVAIEGPLRFYYFALAFVALSVLALKRVLESPFGRVLQAIRESEERARACGYDTDRVKLLSFILSGFFSGLAGVLSAVHLSFVPIESLYWTTSGEVVIMTLLGGQGTFFGPFVGAAVFLLLQDLLSVFTEHWELFLGALFMAFVLYLPRGIWGAIVDLAGPRRSAGEAAGPWAGGGG
jgi:branched-chain amino acid transport system permease protein